MTRRQIRDRVFRLLFRVEFHPAEEWAEQEELFAEVLSDQPPEDVAEIRRKFEAITACLPELDEALNTNSDHWKTSRMGKVDLTLLRLAAYEILHEEHIPKGVAINEAVELAKIYGTEESYAFVNGVLSRMSG